MNKEEADRYVADARTLIEQGNALRDRGLRGSDADMVLSPTRFLELLAEVWEQGFDLGVRREGDRPVNPYRYQEEER